MRTFAATAVALYELARLGRELVLGGDDVDVLKDRDDRERGDRGPRPPHMSPQSDGCAVGWLGMAEPSVQRPRAVQHHRHERQRGAYVGAGDTEADARQHAADGKARRLFADQADADRTVVAEALEEPAHDAQEQVKATRRDPERCRPLLLDAHGFGDRMPQENGGDGRHHGEHEQRLGPAADRGGHPAADAEMTEDSLASGRQLHRVPGDGQDEEVADERGQRSVIGQLAREHDHRAERDHVVGDHRAGQARRLRGVRAS